VTIAQPGPQFEHLSRLTWRDLVIGLRAELAIGDPVIVRGLLRVPPLVHEGPFSRWIFLIGGGGLRGDRNKLVYDLTLGAGVHVAYFDLLAISGARWPEAQGVHVGPVLGGVARLHSVIFGLGVRVEALPSRTAFFTIDLAPLGLLGSLL
jgi:hypothetical protein